MLDDVTKKRINTLRQILVGKLPDPKAQVEQITNGLIYKFMNDMDEQSVSMGGKSTYFSGKFQKYSWKNLMDTKTSGVQKVKLYEDAIEQMYTNENLPELFREIFKNSFLPFKDPSTLNMFLKEINEFNYSNSEKLGDAFEYLLSFMGSQGDAGQFRTPRHIIDFIVEIVNPQKNETILDPACGTSGFLISSYKNILNQNTKKNIGDELNASDRKKIGNNLNGYDISPDMVKMSLVNMYLHKFTNPKINEYDTLSNEDRWNEYYDIILANPPFFSPKGGITPHNRFTIKSSKAEVLFIDYINEHLKPNGRAGIIVPEGIIFQNGAAYKQLRKKLIETSLIGVISLPTGVFNPYAGVKTSVLILDKKLNKENKNIYYFEVKNDGFTLNTNRTPIDKNDLPLIINAFKNNFAKQEGIISFKIGKDKISEGETYSLNIKNYFTEELKSNFELKELGKIVEVLDKKRKPLKKTDRVQGEYPYYGATGIIDYIDKYIFDEELVLVGEDGAKWDANEKSAFIAKGKYWVNNHAHVIKPNKTLVKNSYLVNVLNNMDLSNYITGMTVQKLNQEKLLSIKIPLPSIDFQNKIIDELNSYHKIIDGCNQVIENYKPEIKINKQWKSYKFSEICEIVRGSSPRPKNDKKFYNGPIPRLMVKDLTRDGIFVTPKIDSLTELGATKSRSMKKGEVVIAVSGNPGLPCILNVDCCIHDGFVGCRNLNDLVEPEYLCYLLLSMKSQISNKSTGAVFQNLTTDQLKELDLFIPDKEIQKNLINLLRVEYEIVQKNKDLIRIFKQKIQESMSRIWLD